MNEESLTPQEETTLSVLLTKASLKEVLFACYAMQCVKAGFGIQSEEEAEYAKKLEEIIKP